MLLELLKGLERLQPRILVVQTHHETHIHSIVVQVIKKAASISVRIERPADAVSDETGLGTPGWQLPEFFETQAIRRRRLALIQFVASDQLFGDRAATALRQNGHRGENFRTRRVLGPRASILEHAHVADPHAGYGAGGIMQGAGRRESGKDVDTRGLGLLREPGREL